MTTPSFPNFAGKHDHDAVITPSDVVSYLFEDGRPRVPIPDAVVLTYQRTLLRRLEARPDVRTVEGYPGPWRRLLLVERPNGLVGIAGGFGIGAPAVATVVEELVALGVRRFLNVGGAGTLQPSCAIGSTVLCTRAIRDEGLSHHYLPAEKFVDPSPSLTRELGRAMQARSIEYHQGPTWTVDAPYRETVAEARSYQAEGILTVEMEAAAVFAVAAYRNVEAAAAFVVTDSLAEVRWTQAFAGREVASALDVLVDVAIDAALEP